MLSDGTAIECCAELSGAWTHSALWCQLQLHSTFKVRLLHDLGSSNVAGPLFPNLVLLDQSRQAPAVVAGLGADYVEVRNIIAGTNILDDVFWDTRQSEATMRVSTLLS